MPKFDSVGDEDRTEETYTDPKKKSCEFGL